MKLVVDVITLLAVGAAAVVTYCILLQQQDAAERSLRAYVGVDDIILHCLDCDPPDPPQNLPIVTDQRNTVVLKIKNYGQTPAHVAAYFTTTPVSKGQYLPKDFGFPPE